jgi:hypothetical protein
MIANDDQTAQFEIARCSTTTIGARGGTHAAANRHAFSFNPTVLL